MTTTENLLDENQTTIFSMEALKLEQSTLLNNVDINILLEQNYKYYQEFLKIFETNRILKTELSCLLKERNDLKQMIARLERRNKKVCPTFNHRELDDIYTNRKRHRRGKNEIRRMYECEYPNCRKKYGSEGSLNQHIKLKHGEKEYDKIIEVNECS